MSSKLVTKAPLAQKKNGYTKTTALKAGCVPIASLLYASAITHSQITYFNQRRIIADAQKERLAQAKIQTDSAKR